MVNLIMNTIIFSHLTGECPNVTVCYKQKMTFFNTKFYQICPKIATIWPLFGLQNPQKLLGIHLLNL